MFAMIIIKVIVASLFTLYSPNGSLAIQLNDQHRNNLSNVEVIASHENTLFVLRTNSNGMVDFGNLDIGVWTITTCNNVLQYEVVEGNSSALIMVNCNLNYNYLPLVRKD
jgi:hypothetical protein